MGGCHDLHGIGNMLAGGQGVEHALVVHGNAVAHADRGKFHGRSTGQPNACLDGICNLVQMQMPGNNFVLRVYDTNDWAGKFFLRQSKGAEK
ncbi:hypothetical protein SDC9_168330 [bioreactor metagenome]|uniref:Uncharacterized protein n=1 Tax=bioreactor metagenome TaxID=1076179 RepID=A0A645G291_9ZZZZ